MNIIGIIPRIENKGSVKVIVTAERILQDYLSTDFNKAELVEIPEDKFAKAIRTFEIKKLGNTDVDNADLVETFRKRMDSQHSIRIKNLKVEKLDEPFDEILSKMRIVVSNNISEYEKPGSSVL